MLIYDLVVFVLKILLLSMLIRVFGPQKKAVLLIKIFLGFVIAYYLSGIVVRIRICWPPSAYWTGQLEKCLDIFAIFTADSAISLITDGVILVLPLFLTRSLQMPTVQKLRIAGILGAGGLATISNVYRMVLMVDQGRSADLTNFIIKLLLTGYVSLRLQDPFRARKLPFWVTDNSLPPATPKAASDSSAPASPPSTR
jgi:hypothetical protein